MAYLTQKARKMLDEAGWTGCTITVSNSLDERLIANIIQQGAKIDSFGVGERLITSKSSPVFGGVYKLCAVEQDRASVGCDHAAKNLHQRRFSSPVLADEANDLSRHDVDRQALKRNDARIGLANAGKRKERGCKRVR
jgi:nicotinic acid phosphoribosyltransferase